jgi:hypothetical protein
MMLGLDTARSTTEFYRADLKLPVTTRNVIKLL